MSINVELRTQSDGVLPPGLLLMLTYSDPKGYEWLDRLTPPSNAFSLEESLRGALLTRIRVFAPPADLLFDRLFVPGSVWQAKTQIVINDPAELRGRPSGSHRPLLGNALRRASTGGHLINTRAMQLVPRGAAETPLIAGLPSGGEVGAPSLPVEVHYVLVPPGMRPRAATAIPDPVPVRVPSVAPHIVAPMKLDSPRRAPFTTMRSPQPRPLAPRRSTQSPPSVRLDGVVAQPWGIVATITLRPVQYDERTQAYVHQPKLGYRVDYDEAPASGGPLFPNVTTREQAGLLASSLNHPNVFLPPGANSPGKWIYDPAALLGAAKAAMVIITDNQTWSGTAANPPFLAQTSVAADGPVAKSTAGRSMIDEFERLAYWKTSRGLRTKVVPISTIVAMHAAGELNPFLPGKAFDAPEMIRAFIAWAVKAWGTTFVLLGGTPHVVPMRRLYAGRGADFVRGKNLSVLPSSAGRFVAWLSGPKAQATNLADVDVDIDHSFSLLCVSSGTILPYAEDSSTGRGWSFKTLGFDVGGGNPLPAPEGGADHPLSIRAFGGPELQDDLAWVWPGRACESDHYYSDLTRSSAPRRDFDANGNLLLGEIAASQQPDVSVDGMKVQGSVYVGRAPVHTADEARNFIDKVIGYEQLGGPDAPAVDATYLTRTVNYSDNWAHPWNFSQLRADANTKIPGPGQYVAKAGDFIVQLQDEPLDDDLLATRMSAADVTTGPPYRLQAVSDTTGTIVNIPYDSSGTTKCCWYFCDSDYQRVQAVDGAKGSPYVRVVQAPVGTDFLFWQSYAVDLGSSQKERVYAEFQTLFAQFDQRQRFYRDYVNFAGEDVKQITRKDALAMLDAGPHFLSVTGHGNVAGQGYLDTDHPCANVHRPSIMYVHSCLTAHPGAASLGQFMTTQRNGALAYVGYARSCLTGDPIAQYEVGFWCGVASQGRLGPPIALHLNATNWQQFDHVFMMILFGDPEMPVWISPPRKPSVEFVYNVTTSGAFAGSESVSVKVTDGGNPVANLNVTALQGWKGSNAEPELYNYTTTDDTGAAWLLLKAPRKSALRVVVSSPPGSKGQLYAPVIKDYLPGQIS